MEKQSNLVLPISIVVGALLIGGAVYFALSGKKESTANQNNQQQQQQTNQGQQLAEGVKKIPGIRKDDAILGNPNADVVFIEYSDLDCPACKVAHPELEKIIQEYGKTGKVAWVYRHLPIVQLHPEAYKKSQASECVYKLGGNDAFWKFIKQVFENDKDDLEAFAVNAGVDKEAFLSCLSDENFAKEKIDANIELISKITNGQIFTPLIVVYIPKTGDKIPLPGAQPYEKLKAIVDGVAEMTN